MPDPRMRLAAEAEFRLRQMRLRESSAHKFDFWGDECGCVCVSGQCKTEGCEGCGRPLGLGQCREHYRCRPAQRPPGAHRSQSDRADWDTWLVEAGRGFGKTFTGATYVTKMVADRIWTRIALVNETVKDVRTVQIEGSGGLKDVCPPWMTCHYEPSKATVTWYLGPIDDDIVLAVATIYSAEEPGQLRGPQFDGGWCDELAKWKYRQQETWDMLQFGMRLGDRPRVIVTTTPRPTPTYLAVRSDPGTVITGGSTRENLAQLAPSFIKNVYRRYQGTRLGSQELDAAVLLDTPGALWNTDLLERTRIKPDGLVRDARGRVVPVGVQFMRVVVAVDPSSASLTDPDSQNECGIVVVARGSDGHGYTLDDRSMKGTPADWAVAVLRAYLDWDADCIVAERNNGGAMVEDTLRNAQVDGREVGRYAPIKTVWASLGKRTRAEPVSMLFEQGVAHMAGLFGALEQQLTTWNPDEDDSPDRLDAMVWGFFEALVQFYDGGAPLVIP